MKKTQVLIAFLAFLLTAWPNVVRAQGGFDKVTGDAVTKAVPSDFSLEKGKVPVMKASSVLLKNAKGNQVVWGMLDTAALGPKLQRKYTGMIITDTKIYVCGISIMPGSYGFGLRPPPPGEDNATFFLYNQAGNELGECPANKDASIKVVKPLTVTPPKGGVTMINMFKYSLDLK